MMNSKYSVLMSLYINDNAKWFRVSINSMLNQTVPPDEVLIVCDGPLTEELEEVLLSYKKRWKELFTIVRLPKNVGLGAALNKGLPLCRNELIARMDADDYSSPQRCEKQLQVFADCNVDVVGCNVNEFVGSIDNIVAHVILPEKHEDIVTFARRRCPIRHPALMYKKSSVMKVNNYKEYRHAQDYNLIVRMIMDGSFVYNIQEPLVFMRTSEDFYMRRGGLSHAKIVLKLKKEFFNCHFYSLMDYIISGYGNAIIAILPNRLRKRFYNRFLRSTRMVRRS